MPSRLLTDADTDLADPFMLGKIAYEHDHPGKRLIVTCTRRTVAEQQALYAQGRTAPGQIVTQVDGVTKLSNHNYNPARALDFAIRIGGTVTWDPAEYIKAAPYFKRRGLAWGGDWKTFKDMPHLEMKP